MWNGTRTLAEKIAQGIGEAAPDVKVKVFNRAMCDENDLITEVFKSKAVVIGSPTISNSIIHSMAGFIHLMKEMKFKRKGGCLRLFWLCAKEIKYSTKCLPMQALN
jgi:anaerobic nitric oxide reductase flavorubredoxin